MIGKACKKVVKTYNKNRILASKSKLKQVTCTFPFPVK